MCNQITKSNEKCKLEPNKPYCHIHKKLIIKHNLKKEIINLNKTIEKKSLENKELKKNLEFFKNEVNELNNKINSMIDHYNKYEVIKNYNKLKNELININPQLTPYKILNDPYYKNLIENKYKKSQEDLKNEFTNLRINRNLFCH